MWLIARDAAVKSGMKKHIVVSTDDNEILWTAGVTNTLARRRPEALADSKASIHWALVDALQWVESLVLAGKRRHYDAVACIPANVPTVTAAVLDACVDALRKTQDATAAMTVKPVSEHPEWMWSCEGGFLSRTGTSKAYRMQDLPERFIATGTCCVVRRSTLLKCKTQAAYRWLGDRIVPVVETGPVIEVHDANDLELARRILT